MIDDVVYRELAILKKNCWNILRTINELQRGLENDERFSRLRPVRETTEPELFVKSNMEGPQAPSNPFS